MKIAFGPTTTPPEATFWEAFSRSAHQYGTRPALVFEGGSLSFADLVREVLNLASRCHALDLSPKPIVGVLLDHSKDVVTAFLATMAMGGVYVPISPVGDERRIREIVHQAKIDLVISTENIYTRLRLPRNCVKHFFVDALQETPSQEFSPASVYRHSSDIAYIIFTSGSTGVPKGVRIPHQALMNYLSAIVRRAKITETDRGILCASHAFDLSIHEIGTAMLSGASLLIPTLRQLRLPDDLGRLMASNKITYCSLSQKLFREVPNTYLFDLRALFLGAEVISRSTFEKALATVDTVFHCYGPTETTVAPVMFHCASIVQYPVPIGQPIDNHYVFLVDTANCAQILDEGIGEIVIGGLGVACGYTEGASDKDRGRFDEFRYPSCLEPGQIGRLYFTGDLGEWGEDGNLMYRGRCDHQVKINGVRVELEDIEQRIFELPGVEDVLVSKVVDHQGYAFLEAEVVSADSDVATEIRSHLRGAVPVQFIPRRIRIVPSLPRNANGKKIRHRPSEPAD